MKKIRIFSVIASFFAISIIFTGCTEDETVVENARDKFLGTWSVEESCVRLDFEVEIEAATGSDTKVLLYNFAFTGPGYDPAYGFVSGNTVDLPQQVIGDNWIIEGSGAMQTDGTIIWNYYIEIGANGSNCQAEFQK